MLIKQSENFSSITQIWRVGERNNKETKTFSIFMTHQEIYLRVTKHDVKVRKKASSNVYM